MDIFNILANAPLVSLVMACPLAKVRTQEGNPLAGFDEVSLDALFNMTSFSIFVSLGIRPINGILVFADIDECQTLGEDPQLHHCTDPNARCVNTPGSYRCKYRPKALQNPYSDLFLCIPWAQVNVKLGLRSKNLSWEENPRVSP